MFYVSGGSADSIIEITDSDDGVVDKFTNKELVNFVAKHKVKIYGLNIYNHTASIIPVVFGNKLKSDFMYLVNNNKKINNPWTVFPVETFMSSFNIGTKITIEFEDDIRGRLYYGSAILVRKSYDDWLVRDKDFILDNTLISTDKATIHLLNCTNGMKKYKLTIKEG